MTDHAAITLPLEVENLTRIYHVGVEHGRWLHWEANTLDGLPVRIECILSRVIVDVWTPYFEWSQCPPYSCWETVYECEVAPFKRPVTAEDVWRLIPVRILDRA